MQSIKQNIFVKWILILIIFSPIAHFNSLSVDSALIEELDDDIAPITDAPELNAAIPLDTLSPTALCGGAVQCNCGDTLTSSQTMWYNLTGCTGDGLIIGANDITLDCNGNLIHGDDSLLDYGLQYWQYSKNGTTIKNCDIEGFYYGIGLWKSSNNILTNIKANFNTYYGIFLGSSSNNNTLTGITANSNWEGFETKGFGIYIDSSSNNRLTNITANSNHRGIFLGSSSNNTLTGINASENHWWGIHIDSSSNNRLVNISANSNIYFGIALDSSSNNQLTNITANNNDNSYYDTLGGIYLNASSNNRLTGITANSNYHGVYLVSNSNNNTFTGVKASSNHEDGIYLGTSANNQLTGITANTNQWDGIHIYSSSNNNVFRDGNISGNTHDDVYLSSTSISNIFTNVSYNISEEYVATGSQLIRKWYYRAFVNDSLGNIISNANITSYNRTGHFNFNLTTDATGYTSLAEISDYINNGLTRTYSSNYMIYANHSGYPAQNHSFNAGLGNNYKDVFTLSAIEISACGNLEQANSVYTLQNNISTNGTCFIILANNITLDLNGFRITGDDTGTTDYGVYVPGYNYATIKNGEIFDFSNGVFLHGSSNNQLAKITSNSNQYRGIELNSCFSNILTNITANDNIFDGILILASSNNQLINISSNSNTGEGIFLHSSSNNILKGITAKSNNQGIDIGLSSNNFFSGITANSNGFGIHLSLNSNNNIFHDGNISSNIVYDIYLQSSNSNNTFTNVSYNIGKEYVESGSQLIRKWHYRAFVKNSLGSNVGNATVTAYNRTGWVNFNLTTDTSGYTAVSEILDYINSGGNRTYSSNYTIYAAKSPYLTKSHGFNASLGNNLGDVFILSIGDFFEVNVTYLNEWNMVSLPVNTTNMSVSALYPERASNVFKYDRGYVIVNEVTLGSGYWIKFNGSFIKNYSGGEVTELNVPVKTGWNIIGGISGPVAVSSIVSVPAGIVSSNYYGYGSGYYMASALQPGKAYWVKAIQPGMLNLTTSPTQQPSNSINFEGFNTIKISDSSGSSQTLYFGSTSQNISNNSLEMPAKAPAFDARYSSDRVAEIIPSRLDGALIYNISITSTNYPISLSWTVQNASYLASISYMSNNQSIVQPVSPSGSITISDPKVVKVLLAINPMVYRNLNVTKIGIGSGAVAGGSLNCGVICNNSYVNGTTIILSATPSPDSQFSGWGGACSGTGTCTLAMNSDKTVVAAFNKVSVTITKLPLTQ